MPGDANLTSHRTNSILRNRQFLFLWMGHLASEFGTGLTSVAGSLIVYRETDSAASVGYILIAAALPALLFGLIAGVFVDRFNRKKILVLSGLLRAVLALLVPFLLPFGIHWLFILIGFSSIVKQFFNPAQASVIMEAADDEELAAADSFIISTARGALALGFAVAGLLSSVFTAEWAFFIAAMTYLVSAVVLMFISLPAPEIEDTTNVATVAKNLKTGALFVLASPALRSVFMVFTVAYILLGLLNALMLPFAVEAVDATAFDFGLIEGTSVLGFIAGGLLLAWLMDRLREGQWIVLGLIGIGLTVTVYSQISTVAAAIGLSIIITFMNVPTFVGRQLLIQRYTSRDVRPRVTSASFVLRDIFFVVGMAMAGLADFIPIRYIFLTEGLLLVGLGIITTFMPGLGQPAAQWLHAVSYLRGVSEAPGLEVGRSATLRDLEHYGSVVPALAALELYDRLRLIPGMTYTVAAAGTLVVRQRDASDAAYFVLEGHAVAGRIEDGKEIVLGMLNPGDFFGEIAALTGVPRTANVITDQPSILLRVPAATLHEMDKIPELDLIFNDKLRERLGVINVLDVPRAAGYDQATLLDIRTPDLKTSSDTA